MLDEDGPHGIAIWDSNNTSPRTTGMGMFSYGLINNAGAGDLDPKGAGGDVAIYGGCQSCNISGPTVVCDGDQVTLSIVESCPDMEFQWSVSNGATIVGSANMNSVTIDHGTTNFVASVSSGQVAQACTHSVTLIELTTSSSSTDVTCANGNDGTGSITVSGGTSPYTYLWDNNETTATATSLTVGPHDVIVTDSNGCTATESVTIGNVPVPCFSIGIVRN